MWWYLAGGIQVVLPVDGEQPMVPGCGTQGIIAAILNIQIPILLGDLINVIAKSLTAKVAVEISKINPIAAHLLVLYAGQAVFTFLYITCLSIMGERIAADLRVRLFEHLLQFDMTFYDQQRTSELNDRLNFDVQEFKSCFKACVAQGLRTSAQVNFHSQKHLLEI
uniref:ABC transmembrane type-1 domain-containing protein n=1 Tax=Ditylenchus dipsaci TaxID=166011 RepID=A0A915DFY0_9BILA